MAEASSAFPVATALPQMVYILYFCAITYLHRFVQMYYNLVISVAAAHGSADAGQAACPPSDGRGWKRIEKR